jgi:hypothetical protein
LRLESGGVEDAELLVYLVEEETDIYIGHKKQKKKDLDTSPYIHNVRQTPKRGLGLFLGRQFFLHVRLAAAWL